MEVSSEMEVDLLHRKNLSISATCSTAFHTEAWTERRLPKSYDGFLADLIKSKCQTHRYSSLTDTCLGCSNCSNKYELAFGNLFLINQLTGNLRHIAAILIHFLFRNSDTFSNLGNSTHFDASGNFDICLHVIFYYIFNSCKDSIF